MRTDGRTDGQKIFNSSSAVVHRCLKVLDWIGQFVIARPSAVSTAIAKCSNAFLNISINCLTWFVNMTLLFHNEVENSSEVLKLGFVLSSSFSS